MTTSPATRAFLIRLIDELEAARCSPVLLRNFEGFPDEIGNDLDVYVRPQRIYDAFAVLNSCARAEGGSISHIHRRGYFIAIWLRFPDCEPPVHIDLYHGALTWHGLHFLDDDELVGNSRPAEPGARQRIPAPCHEALISLLASILWGGYFKQRYQDRLSVLLDDARQFQEFSEILERTFGREGAILASAVRTRKTANLITDSFSRRLRQRLVSHSLKVAFMPGCLDWLRHWLEEIVCYVWRIPGMVIEYDEQAWDASEVEKIRNAISPYFGGVHTPESRHTSLMGPLKVRRLRGKNHLVLLRSSRFAINRKPYAASAVPSSPDPSSMAEAAIQELEKQAHFQATFK